MPQIKPKTYPVGQCIPRKLAQELMKALAEGGSSMERLVNLEETLWYGDVSDPRKRRELIQQIRDKFDNLQNELIMIQCSEY